LVNTSDLDRSLRSKNELLVGGAIFGALAVILTTISQALVLSFPLIPYLQFDLGEIAILLALYIFGPVPALTASFVEFATLWVVGQNLPVGPPLKLAAILSSLVGIWLGVSLASRSKNPTIGKAAGLGTSLGVITRAVAMTFANYLVIVLIYTVPGIVGAVTVSLRLVGITVSQGNALAIVLGFTFVFNVLQLLFAAGVSYLLLSIPQVRNAGVARRSFWVTSYMRSRE
jgi:riboflavin transporter FmnP